MAENPFSPPPPAVPPAGEGPKPKWKQAKLAWVLPLTAMVLAIVLNAFGVELGALGALIAWSCLIGGTVYTILGFARARKYSNALPHAIGGCVTLVIWAALCIVALIAVMTLMTRGST